MLLEGESVKEGAARERESERERDFIYTYTRLYTHTI